MRRWSDKGSLGAYPDRTHDPSQTPLRNQRNSIKVLRPAVSFFRHDFHCDALSVSIRFCPSFPCRAYNLRNELDRPLQKRRGCELRIQAEARNGGQRTYKDGAQRSENVLRDSVGSDHARLADTKAVASCAVAWVEARRLLRLGARARSLPRADAAESRSERCALRLSVRVLAKGKRARRRRPDCPNGGSARQRVGSSGGKRIAWLVRHRSYRSLLHGT